MTVNERARFEVLLENIQSQLTLLAEGHAAVIERLDRIETKVDALERRVDALERGFQLLDRRLGRIEKHLKLNGRPARSAKRPR